MNVSNWQRVRWGRWIFPIFSAIAILAGVASVLIIWGPVSAHDLSFTAAREFVLALRTELEGSEERVRWILLGGPIVAVTSLAAALIVWLLVPERIRSHVELGVGVGLVAAGGVVWVLANDVLGVIGAWLAFCGAAGAILSRSFRVNPT